MAHRRVQLEVDLSELRSNYAKIAAAVDPCAVFAVLKANAYGLGVRPVADALKQAGAKMLAVAELNEALELLPLNLPVMILGSILPDEIDEAVAAGIRLPVTDLESAGIISASAARQNKHATAHILVDSGMGRLGMPVAEALEAITAINNLPHLTLEGIYSHFPMAYQSGGEYTNRQIEAVTALLQQLEKRDISFKWRHIANSDAVNNFPRTCREPFNAVRTGINLHGSFDLEGRRRLDLKPVLTLRARLAAVRRLPAGMCIGYGCTYRLPREMTVGTVSAGYADGLPLALSNRGYLLINGYQCPVIGRISMDYTTVDLSQVPDARCGDEVICLGGTPPHAISVEDWANIKGTHSYDIICSFGSRVERVYKG